MKTWNQIPTWRWVFAYNRGLIVLVVRDVNLPVHGFFLSVRVYLWHETTRSMGLAY
ncbi:unnamed protein product [Brassica napus]|uniref:(rape) hypothetical protein n=1 Tax=Brassica napus TaxID=3708 RepID=A0A816J0Z8_BRANA|nr:unnamed protein product [Brassica napus]